MIENEAQMRDVLREQEATIQLLKGRLRYWADQIEEDADYSRGEALQALREMRQTADEL